MQEKTFLIAVSVAAAAVSFCGCKNAQNKIVARAGSVKITTEELGKELLNSPPAYQTYLSTLDGKKQFLDILLRERILLNAAERSGIARRKEIQNNLKEYKERAKEQEAE